MYVTTSSAPRSRFGLIVPKHGRRVVDRNRLKRRLREIGRRDILPTLDASEARQDVLVRARSHAYEAGFDALRLELKEAVEGLWSRVS